MIRTDKTTVAFDGTESSVFAAAHPYSYPSVGDVRNRMTYGVTLVLSASAVCVYPGNQAIAETDLGSWLAVRRDKPWETFVYGRVEVFNRWWDYWNYYARPIPYLTTQGYGDDPPPAPQVLGRLFADYVFSRWHGHIVRLLYDRNTRLLRPGYDTYFRDSFVPWIPSWVRYTEGSFDGTRWLREVATIARTAQP